MGRRVFNKSAYDNFDMPAKQRLVEVIEAQGIYKLASDINAELYKQGDLVFTNGKHDVIFENEVRINFDTIVNKYTTIHIPVRKKNTPADFYLVWRTDLWQFIMIKRNVLRKYMNTCVEVTCNHEMNQDGAYDEYFIDIPKEETQWYVIGEGFKLTKVTYD